MKIHIHNIYITNKIVFKAMGYSTENPYVTDMSVTYYILTDN